MTLISSHPTAFPGGASGKEPACRCRRRERQGFDPWVGKIPWRRAWQPTPVFLPGESHGEELAGCTPWGREELDTTEGLSTRHTHQELLTHRLFTSDHAGPFSPGSRAESRLGGPCGVGPGHSSLALSPTRPVKAVPPAAPHRGSSQHRLAPRGQDSQGQHPQLPGLRPTGE